MEIGHFSRSIYIYMCKQNLVPHSSRTYSSTRISIFDDLLKQQIELLLYYASQT